MDWHMAGEIFAGLVVAFQTWLLKSTWDSKPSREEVLKLFKEFEDRDAARDAEQMAAILRTIDGMRHEARECFADVREDVKTVGRRVDEIMQTLARPRGH